MAKTVSPLEAERDALARVRDLDLDIGALSIISNVFRLANAFRNYTERSLLSDYGLSFSGFTVLWVLWIWGPRESGALAADAGITKGTLTGVMKTLEGLGLAERLPHQKDGRRVTVRATRKGKATMRRLFPRFNRLESTVTSALSAKDREAMTHALRLILQDIPSDDAKSAD